MIIKVLPPSDARRIAAGEVIDRPSSALRELLDNAIDALATHIVINLEQGGIKSLAVTDNGSGMARDDLEQAILPHATSKISSVTDLQKCYSLGFRGEALASLAACSFLEIKSCSKTGEGYLLNAADSQLRQIIPCAMPIGTQVKVSELFYNLSARRRFLKGQSAEGRDAQQIFFEKALAFPNIAFDYYSDTQLKFHLEPSSQLERVKALLSQKIGEASFIDASYSLDKDGFTLQMVASPPTHYRSDRRYIQLYINGRRIIEYALIQAVMHAYSSILPAGQFPVCFMFMTVRADLADFNIHPAKREAKFHHLPLMHKAVVRELGSITTPLIKSLSRNMVQSHQGSLSLPMGDHPVDSENYTSADQAEPLSRYLPLSELPAVGRFFSDDQFTTSIKHESEQMQGLQAGKSNISTQVAQKRLLRESAGSAPWHYLGQLMGVFLLVEWGNTLYLIDQHAAHERILFDRFAKTPLVGQRLLTPIELEVTTQECSLILLAKDDLAHSGVIVEAYNDTTINIVACPSQMDLSFWEEFAKKLSPAVSKELFATMACRGAVKEGEYLDQATACNLIKETFALPHPFCPHGRPVWIEIGQDQLYKWVKRII